VKKKPHTGFRWKKKENGRGNMEGEYWRIILI
jgi:hypothetical protein